MLAHVCGREDIATEGPGDRRDLSHLPLRSALFTKRVGIFHAEFHEASRRPSDLKRHMRRIVMLNGSNGQRLEHAQRCLDPTVLTGFNVNEASRAACDARLFIDDSLNRVLCARPIQSDITQFLGNRSGTRLTCGPSASEASFAATPEGCFAIDRRSLRCIQHEGVLIIESRAC